MTGEIINKKLNLGAAHALYYHLGDWYHLLQRFPGILIDKNGYVIFETEDEYRSNQSLKHGAHLHVRKGISLIPTYIKFTEEQLFIINQVFPIKTKYDHIEFNGQAERRARNIDSIIRNQLLVRQVKKLRNNTCQICLTKLQIGPNSYYSEVHHIKPLGSPHNGPDILSNMLCVCPNCHVKLDYGFFPIDSTAITNIANHIVDVQYINYHNTRMQIII